MNVVFEKNFGCMYIFHIFLLVEHFVCKRSFVAHDASFESRVALKQNIITRVFFLFTETYRSSCLRDKILISQQSKRDSY